MDLTKFIERATPQRVLSVQVSQDGERIASHFWEGDCRRNLYSAAKSYTSAAVGIAIREGLLSLDEHLTDAFAEDLPAGISPNLEKATVRDLLTMCLGQGKGFLMGDDRPFYRERNWVRLSLAQPFDYAPGERFVYSNVGPYLAGILVQRRAGCDLTRYLTPRFFEPLGIPLPTWENDPLGNTFGAGGLFLCAREFHRFGELYLREGEWNGRQLVPAAWVRESCKKQVENGQDGYGYLMWGGPHGAFRADGKYCQACFILRDKRAVITVTAEHRGGGLMDTIFEELYPQL